VIDELRQKYSLKILLSVSGLPKSTYCYHRSDRHLAVTKKRSEEDSRILKIIIPVFEYHKQRYGYRRIALACAALKGVNHKKLQRIMKENGLFGKHQESKKRYHSFKGDNGEPKENLLLDTVIDPKNHKTRYVRNFSTASPNEKWTTDVSEFKGPDGRLYLSPILDMYDGTIVSYDINTFPDLSQIKRMLDKAFEDNPDLNGLILHSDRGWQYQMDHYQEWLKDKGIRQSFSRKGNCLDNSLMENFFSIMKNEMFIGNQFQSLEELKDAMDEYISYYNYERISVKRKGLTPMAYRQQSLSQLQYSY